MITPVITVLLSSKINQVFCPSLKLTRFFIQVCKLISNILSFFFQLSMHVWVDGWMHTCMAMKFLIIMTFIEIASRSPNTEQEVANSLAEALLHSLPSPLRVTIATVQISQRQFPKNGRCTFPNSPHFFHVTDSLENGKSVNETLTLNFPQSRSGPWRIPTQTHPRAKRTR